MYSKPGGSVRQPYLTYGTDPLDSTLAGGIDPLKSIPGLLECLQIRAQSSFFVHNKKKSALWKTTPFKYVLIREG